MIIHKDRVFNQDTTRMTCSKGPGRMFHQDHIRMSMNPIIIHKDMDRKVYQNAGGMTINQIIIP